MTIEAQVQNGLIVPLTSLPYPEGTKLRIEAEEIVQKGNLQPRVGGEWRDRVYIAPDFDELPSDIANAFGIE